MKEKKTVTGWGILLLAGFFILTGCGELPVYRANGAEEAERIASFEAANSVSKEEKSEEEETEPSEPEKSTIWVDVCGAVERPGVYELPEGSRVFAAIRAAGGLTEEAEARSLNQAAPLRDGEQILVLTREEAEAAGTLSLGAAISGNGSGGKINLNTATREELMTLPGIGEARAAAILRYREEHGPFATIEEIMNIEGIKEKGFEKIKEEIEV